MASSTGGDHSLEDIIGYVQEYGDPAELRAWADKVRRSLMASDEIEVERQPTAGVVVSVRLSPREADALRQLASERKSTLSDLARTALTAMLAPNGPNDRRTT